MKKIFSAFIIGVTTLSAGANAAQLSYGTYLKSTHNIVQDAVKPYLDEITEKTNGSVTFKYFTDGTVVSATTAAKGVQQGLIDMGMILPLYAGSTMPMTAIFSNLPQLKSDSLVTTAVINELFFLNCEECQSEWASAKLLPIALYATSPYYLQCSAMINRQDDLKGKRIQVMSADTGAFASEIGGLPVNLTISELYTGMSQGTLDCFVGSMSWLQTYGTKDVVKSIIDVPLGVFRPMSHMNMNAGKWNRLNKEEQQAFVDGVVKLVANSAYSYAREHQTAYDDGVASGIKFVAPFPGFEEAYDRSTSESGTRFLDLAQKVGIKDPQRLLDRYLELGRQWRDIVANAQSQEDYEKALDERIFSKVTWPGKK